MYFFRQNLQVIEISINMIDNQNINKIQKNYKWGRSMEVKRFYKNQTEISAAINKVIDSYLNDKIDEESMVKNIKIIYENNYSKIIKNGDYAKVLKQRCGKRRLEIVSKVISQKRKIYRGRYIMKTLCQACTPRQSVFDDNTRDDVLEITDLIQNRIDPNEFFNENFATEGMKLLVETAFKRFHGKNASGLIKLTQSMGGGKTHNMIALALLAKYPQVRNKVLGDMFKESYIGEVKVVGFTGRESDAEFGIWGAIAEQLGKKEQFKDYYSPLQAQMAKLRMK